MPTLLAPARSASTILPDPKRDPQRQYESMGWDRVFKTHPAIPAVLYVPVAALLLWRSYAAPGPVGSTWVLFVAGLLGWTLLEYLIHRGPLHAPLDAWWTFGVARVHANHHEHPEDVSAVILSPLQTLPLAAAVYAALRLALPAAPAGAVMAGVLGGYLAYEAFHYAFHAPVVIRWGWLNDLRKYHARHHFETPDRRFGVTCPLWDHVFGTSR